MAKKRSLIVPQEGTQPSQIPSPIDNMISGNDTKASKKTDKTSDKPVKKTPTSFNIDNALIRQFKAVCATQGKTMSSVIEDYIKLYIAGN